MAAMTAPRPTFMDDRLAHWATENPAGEAITYGPRTFTWSQWDERVRRAAGGRPIAVTEKDAVKLGAYGRTLPDVRVLTLAVELESGEDALRADVLAAAAPRAATGTEGADGAR